MKALFNQTSERIQIKKQIMIWFKPGPRDHTLQCVHNMWASPKIWREMEKRRGKTPDETSVLFHATLASAAALRGWDDDWEHQSNHVWDGCRGHPELLAANIVCLSKVLISHSVMFFLEQGYFAGTAISAIPHQVPFRALSPDRGSAALIKCLTDGLKSSICYNCSLPWWEGS